MDIEFHPNRQYNCQVKAVAIYVSMYRLVILDMEKHFEYYYIMAIQ